MKRIDFKTSLNLKNKIYIDVRSPGEFETDHIPGAINIPLLNNDERAIIGTIYKKEGGFNARVKGVDIVSKKLVALVDKLIAETNEYQNIVFYCSRGGLRSLSMASFFKLVLDKPVYIIDKGYKDFRRYIVDYFEKFDFRGNFLVIDGFTGSGKTIILKKLQNKGLPVIDLENLAKHRGSVFGGVGIEEKVSQKKFESLIWKSLTEIEENLIIVEGESKHIGKCLLPNKFYNLMNKSPHVWVETDDNVRLKIIKEDYLKNVKQLEQLIEPVKYLKRLIGKKNVEMLINEIKKKNFDFVILYLLHNYYDLLYKKGKLPDEKFYKKINFDNIEQGVEKIEKIYYELKK